MLKLLQKEIDLDKDENGILNKLKPKCHVRYILETLSYICKSSENYFITYKLKKNHKLYFA